MKPVSVAPVSRLCLLQLYILEHQLAGRMMFSVIHSSWHSRYQSRHSLLRFALFRRLTIMWWGWWHIYQVQQAQSHMHITPNGELHLSVPRVRFVAAALVIRRKRKFPSRRGEQLDIFSHDLRHDQNSDVATRARSGSYTYSSCSAS
ncbi:hypothetical protein BDR07DRAFT_975516 [Suillus spraguei]|nr:hypothetical protein BDR07DRAFT_975516 [Suillus spraguei]